METIMIRVTWISPVDGQYRQRLFAGKIVSTDANGRNIRDYEIFMADMKEAGAEPQVRRAK